MLTRAFTKHRRSPKYGEPSNSASILEYEDCIVGVVDDFPLISCGNYRGKQMTMKEVLRSSVGVMGESCLGMTEKVVLLKGQMFAVKRFRKAIVHRSEFCRRVEKLAEVSRNCKYLVPIAACLYVKRIKFVLCDYYPMGSLADLLAGGRKYGHTALNWTQRLKIILNIARAIDFIHKQTPSSDRNKQMNFHGNVKSSNVMIDIDLSACLSDYGFTQLAERVHFSDKQQQEPPPPPGNMYSEDLSQKGDIFNFGVIIMDILAGSRFRSFKRSILEMKEEIKEGKVEFFEFVLVGRERMRALQILDIALACTNKSPEGRPSIEQILLFLGDVTIK